jgi:lipid A ethanolaminephosphotransferase
MFSHLGREAYEAREGESENLLDLLHRAGLAVLWLDNQSGCKGLCARTPQAHVREPGPAEPPRPAGLCEGGECFDEALLHGLDERLAALPAERRARGVVLVLHQMGSHGPAYWKRSPAAFKRFTPECTTNALQQCSAEGLNNAYDNSIAYTDHLLGRAIDWLARPALRATHEPALLYVSDHGESLGEKGLYLHGMPWALAPRVQTHVPMVVWAPAEGPGGGLMRCLAGRRAQPVSHDHLFHTVLGLTGVRASEYREGLDLTAKCPA